VVTATGDPAPG